MDGSPRGGSRRSFFQSKTVRRKSAAKLIDAGRAVHRIESLEARALLAADTGINYLSYQALSGAVAGMSPQYEVASSDGLTPLASTSPVGLTPSKIRAAYGFDQITFGNGVAGDGSGQTIAIVDAFHDPNIQSDLHNFDLAFGIADPPSFRQVAQDGSTNYPGVDSTGGWETEIALDVEWAHALAPGANILLVEASSSSDSNLIQTAVNYARSQPGVVAVSMSFSGSEFSSEGSSFDSFFTTPSGHNGVTFLAATGDDGAPSGYPAYSPNVVAVGGTMLSVGSNGAYGSETGWSGSGGGLSSFEGQPSYQNGIVTQSSTSRGNPDVAFDADPNSGVAVYDSYNNPSAPWIQVGGTSFSTPSWAALIAVTDQGRSAAGLGTLDGRTQTLPMLYQLPATDFHDITSGNNGNAAGPG
ncbi:MAG TPA: S53 family peptidase, partial [Pirellulales bacterium]